jgi:hypothetical protein
MSYWMDALDGRPGVPLETRYLADSVVVLIQVTWGPASVTRGHLILRCDHDGNISAAISREARISIGSEPK